MSKGCTFDTDGDGNCPIHVSGCPDHLRVGPWMTPGEFAKTVDAVQNAMPGASVSSEAPLSKMLKRFEAAVERIDVQFSRFEKLIGFESSAEKAANRLTLENEKLKAENKRLLACVDRLDAENRDLKVKAVEHVLQAKKREAELEKLTREVKSWRAADSVRQQIESMEVSRLSKELLAEVDADMRRYASQLVDKAIFGPRAAPPRVCQFQLKRVYDFGPPGSVPQCVGQVYDGLYCDHHKQKCCGCQKPASRVCPGVDCFYPLCDDCTHIVAGAHGPKPKGAEPVRCHFGIDGPITRRCYKTALEASIYCEDHQAERCAFGKGTPLRHCWDTRAPGSIYCKDHQTNIEGGALPPGVQSAAETDLAAKPKRDEEYAITFTITPKQGLVTVEKKP